MVTENMDSKRRASALRRISPCPGLYGSASLSRFFQKLNTLPATALLCLLISVFTAGAMRGASESVQGDCRPGGITVKHTGLSKNGRNHAKGKRETKADGPNMLDTLFWGPEIIVEAKRILPDDEIFNRSNFVVLIDLGKRKDRIEDIASILSRTVGVRVKQYGGLGSFATMSIRGSSSNQVQLYMDGVPLNDAYTGTANLADLPLGDVQRIEIFRGFSPTNFGSSAIGGTVNLVTSGNSDREGDRSLP
ncbi:MAG: TonB-dependent receptor, partial [Candidatus Krumholzibacteria bacterium]|nr:TonB-dependent receptor [Candidatus Krumholzibacteria bacterium]